MQATILQHPEQIVLKPNPQWRQYRVELTSEVFYIVPDRIKTPEDLQRWIQRLGPDNIKNIYESTATFLSDPPSVRGLKSKSFPIILDHLILVDIDISGRAGLLEVTKTLDFMKGKQDYQLWKIVASGGGYHVYYKDSMPLPADHRQRFDFIKERREGLRKQLAHAGIKFDQPILTDPWRVSRVIGTINGNRGGAVCKELSLEDVNTLLQTPPDEQGPTTDVRTKTDIKLTLPKAIHFIDNYVPGTKGRYIPVLLWDKRTDYRRILRDRRLKLGRVYVFESGSCFMGISMKTFDSKRLVKIMKRTKSINITSFLKFKHSWIYLAQGEISSTTENIIKATDILRGKKVPLSKIAEIYLLEKPILIDVIDNSPKTYFSSRPHIKTLAHLIASHLPDLKLLHGSESISQQMVIKTGRGEKGEI